MTNYSNKVDDGYGRFLWCCGALFDGNTVLYRWCWFTVPTRCLLCTAVRIDVGLGFALQEGSKGERGASGASE